MRLIALLCTGLLLAGCVTTPRRQPQASLQAGERAEWLQGLAAFHLEGRLAVAVGQEGFSANLDWTQRGERTALELRAPLGFGAAQVLREAGALSLSTSRGETLSGAAAEQALVDRIGFSPPLDSLRYWVLGVADPSREGSVVAGEGGLPTSLEQEGWHVDYPEFRDARSPAGAPLSLPRRLTLTREGLRLRLVVDRWTLGAR
jgi:outer membrane lipoprotein LolB